MASVSGQGGVYLSGEFAINKNGGPLWEDGTRPYYVRDAQGNLSIDGSTPADQCDDGICGLRLAMKLNENSEGWYVLDDLSGGLSFEGLTLQTETLTSVPDYNNVTLVNGEPTPATVALPDGDEVVNIGLPGTIAFNDFKFKFAVSNNGEFGVPLEDGTAFRQTEIFGVQLDGNITVGGNLLLFPVD
ncbi:hypothetical protein NBRC116585_30400 [Thalassolituus maritimus]|uniref:Uncharacterized protein n=2 Tax=Thalassolituus maritimus TaxID=484498 RepID=A0ABQ0A3E8_9GAMM